MSPKPEFCKNCPINGVTTGYCPLGLGAGTELWVGEASGEEESKSGLCFVGGAGTWLDSILRNARIPRKSISLINTIGCRPPDNVYPLDMKWHATDRQSARQAVQWCTANHLWPAVKSRPWTRIVALGDWALRALTPRQGILKWRGSALPLRGEIENGPRVIPTLHPAYLMRNAGLFSVAVGDLKRNLILPAENYNLFPSIEDLKRFTPIEFAFDLEWDEWGNITLCGLSDRYYQAIVTSWTKPYIDELKILFENAKVLVGQNIIGADTKHFEKLGWDIWETEGVLRAKVYDTMLMQHLIQPDFRHNLGFIASVFTKKVFWKGSDDEQEDEEGGVTGGAEWKTWNSADAIPREFGGYGGCLSANEAYRLYNARDTEGSLQCAGPLKAKLEEYGLENVYWNVSVPAAYICRWITEPGLKLDHTKVTGIRETLGGQIEELEVKLPEGLKPYEKTVNKQIVAPPNAYKQKIITCKGVKGNNHDPYTFAVVRPEGDYCACGKFFNPKLTTIKRIKVEGTKRITPWNSTQQVMAYAANIGCKAKFHIKTGQPTADKNARKTWGREHTEFALMDKVKKLSTLRSGFVKPGLINEERMYFNLLVHGTSEGRLASSGRRKGIDAQIQNFPKELRTIFIPDYPDWGIINADIVQGENMLTAWLAKDWERWERLNTPGFDEHSWMASHFFNKAIELVSKGGAEAHLRDPGKVINHGRNYGLGVKKTQEYLATEGYFYSINDIEEMIEIWKRLNKRTAQWQQETIGLAAKQSYLVNPFGRKRWFASRDYATKSLAFLPASTLADMVLRMMIALYPHKFGREINALGLGMIGQLPNPWALRFQVHDSLVAQGPDMLHLDAARVLHAIMTQPWKELDGFAFKVEVEYSMSSWGECKRIEV